MKRYVWLNLNTGEFSNSWDSKNHELLTKGGDTWMDAISKGWKLIEYTCLNDETFELYNKMKIVTNTKTT